VTTDPNPPQPLPGLEHLGDNSRPSQVEVGVRRTLAELWRTQKLTEVDAGRTAVAISLAKMMAAKERSGRGSTFSNDARLLVELLESMAGEAAEGAAFEAQLTATMAQWEAELAKGNGSP